MKLEKITTKDLSASKRSDKKWYDDACGTALALQFVGERWALLIIRELMFGPRRFGAIKANLIGISANVLTQRLEGLEEAGIVVRRQLPPPANVQAYDLTDWGREAEVAIREMGRWAARSPRHNPLAFMSTASMMISLRTLNDPVALETMDMTVAFRFPDDRFVARVADGEIKIVRAESDAADVTFTGDTMALRRTLYGKEGFNSEGTSVVTGDTTLAQAFIALFTLPKKVG